MSQIVYTDGGVIGPNPSAAGGVWAWVLVDAEADLPVREGSGRLTPAAAGLEAVSNNIAELYASLMAFAALPDGWSGCLATDNVHNLRRCKYPWTAKMNGVPPAMIDAVRRERARLGVIEFVLLAGHPSKKDLARGHKLAKPGAALRGETRGLPVSAWNKRCDDLCNAAKHAADEGQS